MAWRDERLLPVERLLYRGRIVKVGQFDCPADHACFPRTAPLQNDLLVFVRRPLWWRRGAGRYRFVEPGAALLHRAILYAIERQRAEQALVKVKERYALAVAGANDCIWDWDAASDQAYFSPRWNELVGISHEITVDSLQDWFERVHPEDVTELRRGF